MKRFSFLTGGFFGGGGESGDLDGAQREGNAASAAALPAGVPGASVENAVRTVLQKWLKDVATKRTRQLRSSIISTLEELDGIVTAGRGTAEAGPDPLLLCRLKSNIGPRILSLLLEIFALRNPRATSAALDGLQRLFASGLFAGVTSQALPATVHMFVSEAAASMKAVDADPELGAPVLGGGRRGRGVDRLGTLSGGAPRRGLSADAGGGAAARDTARPVAGGGGGGVGSRSVSPPPSGEKAAGTGAGLVAEAAGAAAPSGPASPAGSGAGSAPAAGPRSPAGAPASGRGIFPSGPGAPGPGAPGAAAGAPGASGAASVPLLDIAVTIVLRVVLGSGGGGMPPAAAGAADEDAQLHAIRCLLTAGTAPLCGEVRPTTVLLMVKCLFQLYGRSKAPALLRAVPAALTQMADALVRKLELRDLSLLPGEAEAAEAAAAPEEAGAPAAQPFRSSSSATRLAAAAGSPPASPRAGAPRGPANGSATARDVPADRGAPSGGGRGGARSFAGRAGSPAGRAGGPAGRAGSPAGRAGSPAGRAGGPAGGGEGRPFADADLDTLLAAYVDARVSHIVAEVLAESAAAGGGSEAVGGASDGGEVAGGAGDGGGEASGGGGGKIPLNAIAAATGTADAGADAAAAANITATPFGESRPSADGRSGATAAAAAGGAAGGSESAADAGGAGSGGAISGRAGIHGCCVVCHCPATHFCLQTMEPCCSLECKVRNLRACRALDAVLAGASCGGSASGGGPGGHSPARSPSCAFASAYREATVGLLRVLAEMAAVATPPAAPPAVPSPGATAAAVAAATAAAAGSERQLKCRALALRLLNLMLAAAGPVFCADGDIARVARVYICPAVVANAVSPVPLLCNAALDIFVALVFLFRDRLMAEIGVVLEHTLARVLVSPNASLELKESLVRSIARICRDAPTVFELYLNFDCVNFYQSRVARKVAAALAAVASGGEAAGVSAAGAAAAPGEAARVHALRAAAFEAVVDLLGSMHRLADAWEGAEASLPCWAAASRVGIFARSEDVAGSDGGGGGGCFLPGAAAPAGAGEGVGAAAAGAGAGGAVGGGGPAAPGAVAGDASGAAAGAATSGGVASGAASGAASGVGAVHRLRASKLAFMEHVAIFNKHPRRGLEALVQAGFVRDSPESVAVFLLHCPELSKKAVGDYLGEPGARAQAVLRAFAHLLDFAGMDIDAAVRKFLNAFRLPGEAQKIDRMMECFAAKYAKDNPDAFRTEDCAFVLAFSLIMLHTDAHSKHIKPESKMSMEAFVRQNRGIDGGADLPQPYLEALYRRIVAEEWVTEPEDGAGALAAAPAALAAPAPTLASVFGFAPSAATVSRRRAELFARESRAVAVRTREALRLRFRAGGAGTPPFIRASAALRPLLCPFFELVGGVVAGMLAAVGADEGMMVGGAGGAGGGGFAAGLAGDARFADADAGGAGFTGGAGFAAASAGSAVLRGYALGVSLARAFSLHSEGARFAGGLAQLTRLAQASDRPLAAALPPHALLFVDGLFKLALRHGDVFDAAWRPTLAVVSRVHALLHPGEDAVAAPAAAQAAPAAATAVSRALTARGAIPRAPAAGGARAAKTAATGGEDGLPVAAAAAGPAAAGGAAGGAAAGASASGGSPAGAGGSPTGAGGPPPPPPRSPAVSAGGSPARSSPASARSAGTLRAGDSPGAGGVAGAGGVGGPPAPTFDEAAAEALAGAVDLASMELIFARSADLSAAGFAALVGALCAVSAEELALAAAPRVFALRKLVEVVDYNLHRLRALWPRVWGLIRAHFVAAARHRRLAVCLYSVDSLRQLANKFFERAQELDPLPKAATAEPAAAEPAAAEPGLSKSLGAQPSPAAAGPAAAEPATAKPRAPTASPAAASPSPLPLPARPALSGAAGPSATKFAQLNAPVAPPPAPSSPGGSGADAGESDAPAAPGVVRAEIIRPFQLLLADSKTAEQVREFILQTMLNVVQAHGAELGPGWRVVLDAAAAATALHGAAATAGAAASGAAAGAAAAVAARLRLALTILQTILRTFHAVAIDNLDSFVRALCAFASIPAAYGAPLARPALAMFEVLAVSIAGESLETYAQNCGTSGDPPDFDGRAFSLYTASDAATNSYIVHDAWSVISGADGYGETTSSAVIDGARANGSQSLPDKFHATEFPQEIRQRREPSLDKVETRATAESQAWGDCPASMAGTGRQVGSPRQRSASSAGAEAHQLLLLNLRDAVQDLKDGARSQEARILLDENLQTLRVQVGHYWFTIFSGLAQIAARAVQAPWSRSHSLDILFRLINTLGPQYLTPDMWVMTIRGVLAPLFDELHLQAQQPAAAAPVTATYTVSPAVPLVLFARSYDGFQNFEYKFALQLLAGLVINRFGCIRPFIDDFVKLFVDCIRDSPECVARPSLDVLRAIVEAVAARCGPAEWKSLVDNIVLLFAVTTPHALLPPASAEAETTDTAAASSDVTGPGPASRSETVKKLPFDPESVITQCVLQLCLLDLVDMSLRPRLSELPERQEDALLAAVDSAFRFARKFNREIAWRHRLKRLGFLRECKQLPGLLKQEREGLSVLLKSLLDVLTSRSTGGGAAGDAAALAERVDRRRRRFMRALTFVVEQYLEGKTRPQGPPLPPATARNGSDPSTASTMDTARSLLLHLMQVERERENSGMDPILAQLVLPRLDALPPPVVAPILPGLFHLLTELILSDSQVVRRSVRGALRRMFAPRGEAEPRAASAAAG